MVINYSYYTLNYFLNFSLPRLSFTLVTEILLSFIYSYYFSSISWNCLSLWSLHYLFWTQWGTLLVYQLWLLDFASTELVSASNLSCSHNPLHSTANSTFYAKYSPFSSSLSHSPTKSLLKKSLLSLWPEERVNNTCIF